MSKEVILELKNIHKHFGRNHVHRGVNLKVCKGESVGLLGGSGTGKSVLLRAITNLEFIDQGEIHYKETQTDHLSEKEMVKYRVEISYAFQNGALFDSLNVFDNIAFPLFEHTDLTYEGVKHKINTMLKLVDLEGTENLMPSDLSGGMQKRVGMARSLILSPEIILYDEPTAGLDPTNTQNVVNIMNRLKQSGHTSILVTHDIPSALELCDRILILYKGKIIFDDTPDEFLNSSDPIVKKFNTSSGVSNGS